MSIFMVAKCPDCLKVVASEVFGAGESTELFTEEYESNYIVEEAQTAPMIEGCQCRVELARLRAVNAGLVEALRYVKNSMETDQMLEGIDFGNELYVMNEALSRAEQAKPETCVWNYNPAGVWDAACGVVCIGLEAMTFCPACNKRVVKRARIASASMPDW